MYKNGRIENNRGNSGRKRVIDQDTREEMIEKFLKNRWTTAVELCNQCWQNHCKINLITLNINAV
jgi:hypothetical protein